MSNNPNESKGWAFGEYHPRGYGSYTGLTASLKINDIRLTATVTFGKRMTLEELGGVVPKMRFVADADTKFQVQGVSASADKAEHIPADAITERDPYTVRMSADGNKWGVVDRRDGRPRSAHFKTKVVALEVCTAMNESFEAGVAAGESALVDGIYRAFMRRDGDVVVDRFVALLRQALPSLGTSAEEQREMVAALFLVVDKIQARLFPLVRPDQDKGGKNGR